MDTAPISMRLHSTARSDPVRDRGPRTQPHTTVPSGVRLTGHNDDGLVRVDGLDGQRWGDLLQYVLDGVARVGYDNKVPPGRSTCGTNHTFAVAAADASETSRRNRVGVGRDIGIAPAHSRLRVLWDACDEAWAVRACDVDRFDGGIMLHNQVLALLWPLRISCGQCGLADQLTRRRRILLCETTLR